MFSKPNKNYNKKKKNKKKSSNSGKFSHSRNNLNNIDRGESIYLQLSSGQLFCAPSSSDELFNKFTVPSKTWIDKNLGDSSNSLFLSAFVPFIQRFHKYVKTQQIKSFSASGNHIFDVLHSKSPISRLLKTHQPLDNLFLSKFPPPDEKTGLIILSDTDNLISPSLLRDIVKATHLNTNCCFVNVMSSNIVCFDCNAIVRTCSTIWDSTIFKSIETCLDNSVIFDSKYAKFISDQFSAKEHRDIVVEYFKSLGIVSNTELKDPDQNPLQKLIDIDSKLLSFHNNNLQKNGLFQSPMGVIAQVFPEQISFFNSIEPLDSKNLIDSSDLRETQSSHSTQSTQSSSITDSPHSSKISKSLHLTWMFNSIKFLYSGPHPMNPLISYSIKHNKNFSIVKPSESTAINSQKLSSENLFLSYQIQRKPKQYPPKIPFSQSSILFADISFLSEDFVHIPDLEDPPQFICVLKSFQVTPFLTELQKDEFSGLLEKPILQGINSCFSSGSYDLLHYRLVPSIKSARSFLFGPFYENALSIANKMLSSQSCFSSDCQLRLIKQNIPQLHISAQDFLSGYISATFSGLGIKPHESALSKARNIYLEKNSRSNKQKNKSFKKQNQNSANPACSFSLQLDSYKFFQSKFSLVDLYSLAIQVHFKSQFSVCGLVNLGNTCFFNSALQCLMSIPDFIRHFVQNIDLSLLSPKESSTHSSVLTKFSEKLIQQYPNGPFLNDGVGFSQIQNESILVQLFRFLFICVAQSKPSSSINPLPLFQRFVKIFPHFGGFRQHDSQEFLRFFLDRIDMDELDRIKKCHSVEGSESDGNSSLNIDDSEETQVEPQSDADFVPNPEATQDDLVEDLASIDINPLEKVSKPLESAATEDESVTVVELGALDQEQPKEPKQQPQQPHVNDSLDNFLFNGGPPNPSDLSFQVNSSLKLPPTKNQTSSDPLDLHTKDPIESPLNGSSPSSTLNLNSSSFHASNRSASESPLPSQDDPLPLPSSNLQLQQQYKIKNTFSKNPVCSIFSPASTPSQSPANTHSALSTNPQSIIGKTFQGWYHSTTFCIYCASSNVTYQPFFDLTLPVTPVKLTEEELLSNNTKLSNIIDSALLRRKEMMYLHSLRLQKLPSSQQKEFLFEAPTHNRPPFQWYNSVPPINSLSHCFFAVSNIEVLEKSNRYTCLTCTKYYNLIRKSKEKYDFKVESPIDAKYDSLIHPPPPSKTVNTASSSALPLNNQSIYKMSKKQRKKHLKHLQKNRAWNEKETRKKTVKSDFSSGYLLSIALKQTLITVLPRNLIIHLNRFSHLPSGRLVSNHTHTKFDSRIDIYPWVVADRHPNRENNSKFTLKSLIVHRGNMSGGHYVCYKRTKPLEKHSVEWSYISDSHVGQSSLSEVSKQSGYVFFYERDSNL